MRLVSFQSTKYGDTIWINPDHVTVVKDEGSSSVIQTVNDRSFTVNHRPENVVALLQRYDSKED